MILLKNIPFMMIMLGNLPAVMGLYIPYMFLPAVSAIFFILCKRYILLLV